MKKYIQLFACLLMAVSINAQNRAIFYLHGYQGEKEGMKPLQTYINQNFSVSQNVNDVLSYQTKQGMVVAGTDAKAKMNAQYAQHPNVQRNQSIVIGHSLGGLTMREIEKTSGNSLFGGMITIGSPHQGAMIAKAKQEGYLENYFRRSTLRLSDGVTKQLSLPLGLGRLQSGISLFTTTIQSQFAILSGWVLDTGAGAMLGGTDQTAIDMRPDKPYLQGLNTRNSTVPIVSIVGVEKEYPHVRMIASGVWWKVRGVSNGIQDHLRDTATQNWQSSNLLTGITGGINVIDNDTAERGSVTMVKGISYAYRGAGYVNEGVGTVLQVASSICFFCRNTRRMATYFLAAGQAWHGGYHYLNTETTAWWNEMAAGQLTTDGVSDGFIGAASQAKIGAPSFTVENANHAEQTDDEEVKRRLKLVMTRGRPDIAPVFDVPLKTP